MMPGLLALGVLGGVEAEGQAATTGKELKELSSGVFKAGPEKKGSQAKHVSRAFGSGLLKAGNIRLEMHESMQDAGAEHEPVGTHLHNEIWFVQKGTASLFINGTEHTMEAGDVGLVCAGDKHWIKNVGDGELSYFVLAVGPPE
ncbi:Cupin 2 conserved barrel domain protein [Granulicella tundricola MP5ACTX9]|uniref:Cupin 2 conserved barrel domain protein n=2 Tax=Granulicella TaxID=940557 RepID=E8WWA0_GRATM|nr:Cupin 2 conserved barrel domain protein [Granulicella tundricola MP5ACTX9]